MKKFNLTLSLATIIVSFYSELTSPVLAQEIKIIAEVAKEDSKEELTQTELGEYSPHNPTSYSKLETEIAVPQIANTDVSTTSTGQVPTNTQVFSYDDLQYSDSTLQTTSLDIAQVTSVEQLRDVQTSDWAYSALKSLVERYDCLEGYPDSTYRGEQTLTRYEYAAGLSKCLEYFEERLFSNPAEISQADLATLQRLQEDFATEISNLEVTVDDLETRITALEQQQFSTTTKLRGQVLTFLGDAFGENADSANNIAFGYRTRLSLNSSFTGKDNLLIRLQAINLKRFSTATEFPQGSLSGETNETRFLRSGITGNGDMRLNALRYRFPIGDKLSVSLDAFSGDGVLTRRIGPFANPSLGGISYFGAINPLLYPIVVQLGATVQWKAAPWLNFDLSLGSERRSASNPTIGLFDGGYAGSLRSVFDFDKLRFSFTYINTYSLNNGIDSFSGSNAARVTGAGPVVANSYLPAFSYQVSPQFSFGASAGWIKARTLGNSTRGNAQVMDYRFFLSFPNLGKQGNLGGIVFGMQPRLISTSNFLIAEAIGLPTGQRSDRDTGFHIEAFYTHRLNRNIAITPGILWLTAPNHDARNPDVIMGVIRTSFSF